MGWLHLSVTLSQTVLCKNCQQQNVMLACLWPNHSSLIHHLNFRTHLSRMCFSFGSCNHDFKQKQMKRPFHSEDFIF